LAAERPGRATPALAGSSLRSVEQDIKVDAIVAPRHEAADGRDWRLNKDWERNRE